MMGLDPEMFRTVRSNILSTDPMPNPSKIYSMIAHEEQQKLVSRAYELGKEPARAFLELDGAVQLVNYEGSRYPPGGKPMCDYCGKVGHIRPTLQELHYIDETLKTEIICLY